MKIIRCVWILVLGLVLFTCGKKDPKKPVAVPVILPRASADVEAAIQKEFPGAITGAEFSDSIIHYLHWKYHIIPDKILLGVSTCVDDIIYTKNFHLHPEIKGPFHLGGLAGLPFTGISGIEAFAHHIPDSGAMVLMVEPHIGYSAKKGWGYLLRHDQPEPSSCCGALMGTLDKLKKGALRIGTTEDDYQGDKIGELALLHQKEIMSAENPIIQLTRVTSASAEKQIKAYVLDVDLKHVKYVIIITGVIIDTDYMISDYQFLERLLVYDVQKKAFVEELKNPAVLE
jgi:Limiting CO2-inducible proteins B/C beta carbonyic anhydrases